MSETGNERKAEHDSSIHSTERKKWCWCLNNLFSPFLSIYNQFLPWIPSFWTGVFWMQVLYLYGHGCGFVSRWPYLMVVLLPGKPQCGWWSRCWMLMITNQRFQRRCTRSVYPSAPVSNGALLYTASSPTTRTRAPTLTSPTASSMETRTGSSWSMPKPVWFHLPRNSSQPEPMIFLPWVTFDPWPSTTSLWHCETNVAII